MIGFKVTDDGTVVKDGPGPQNIPQDGQNQQQMLTGMNLQVNQVNGQPQIALVMPGQTNPDGTQQQVQQQQQQQNSQQDSDQMQQQQQLLALLQHQQQLVM